MKKNIIFGMLVSLLAIPTFAQVPATDVPQEEIKKKDYSHYTAGSSISVGFGLAGSSLATGKANEGVYNKVGFPSYNVSLRYTYFVYKFMGITTGLDFSNYNSTLGLKGMYAWPAVTDMGIAYQRRAWFADPYSSWSEVENISMIEIPIGLTFKYKPAKVGLIGTVGVKLAFPVAANYQSKGNVTMYNYYPTLNTYEYNGPHMTANVAYEEDMRKYDKAMWSTVNGQVFAEFGALFELHPRLDLSVSVYGNYGLNNVVAANDDFGFANKTNGLNTELAPMANYKGLLGTAVQTANPWSVGGKIALHINCRKKSDEQIAAEAYIAPEVVYVYDTVRQVIKEVIHDTITIEVGQIDSTNSWILEQKSRIFYKVNDAKHPIMQPANLIDLLSSALVGNRNERVVIAGYASSEGQASYNERLAMERAKTVANMLRARGVQDNQIEIMSFGDTKTKNNTDPEDMVRDRRVEVIPQK